jgi:hypothetical protein
VLAKYKYEGKPDLQNSMNVSNLQDVPKAPPQEELPADNMVLTKYVYEGEPDVQNSINVPDVQDVPKVPPQEELLADNVVLTKCKYTNSGNVMTSQTETANIADTKYVDTDPDKQFPSN